MKAFQINDFMNFIIDYDLLYKIFRKKKRMSEEKSPFYIEKQSVRKY